METVAKLRKWGSSLGVVVPSEIVKESGLKEGEEITMEIKKKNPLREAFGSLPSLNIDSQKMKDESRREWKKDKEEHSI